MGYMLVDDKSLYQAVSRAARVLTEFSVAVWDGRPRDPAETFALAERMRSLAAALEADARAPAVIDASE